MQPVLKLLQSQIRRRQYLDGVVMNAGGDAASLLFLGPDEVVKQSPPVSVGQLLGV